MTDGSWHRRELRGLSRRLAFLWAPYPIFTLSNGRLLMRANTPYWMAHFVWFRRSMRYAPSFVVALMTANFWAGVIALLYVILSPSALIQTTMRPSFLITFCIMLMPIGIAQALIALAELRHRGGGSLAVQLGSMLAQEDGCRQLRDLLWEHRAEIRDLQRSGHIWRARWQRIEHAADCVVALSCCAYDRLRH